MVENPRSGDHIGYMPPLGSRVHRTRDLLLLAALILVSGVVIGAGGAFLVWPPVKPSPTPPVDPGPFVDIMKKNYDVTDEQAERIRKAFAEHFETIGKIWQENEIKMTEAREELDTSLKGIMKSEQYAQWKKDMEDAQRQMQRWRQRGRDDRRNNGPGGPGDRDRRGGGPGSGGRGPGSGGRGFGMMLPNIVEHLEDLTEEQRIQIEAIRKRAAEEFAAAGDDMERKQIIGESVNEAIMEVLTEEQRQRVREIQDRMRQGRGGPRGGTGPNDVSQSPGPEGGFRMRRPDGEIPVGDVNAVLQGIPQPFDSNSP